MKRTAYIHIGVPKTGTTAIQSTLQRFFKEGKLNKFDMQFHHGDTWKYIHDFWCTGDEKYFIEQLHESIQQYSKLGERNVIISNEHIASVFYRDFWGFKYDLLPVLAAAFKDYNVKPIIYIRRQDIYVESRINQHAKTACYTTYGSTHIYYKELIDKCVKCFGGEVIVRKYERESLYGGDAVTDFLHVVGLDELIDDYKEHNGKTVNSSLSLSSLRVAMADNRQYQLEEQETQAKIEDIENEYKKGLISRKRYVGLVYNYMLGYDSCRFSKESREIRRRLLTESSNFSYSTSSQGFLSKEEREAILERYAEDNAAVAREYFGSEDGVLFDDKLPKNIIDINSEPTTTDIVQVFMPALTNLALRCHKLEERCRELEKPAISRFFKRIFKKKRR